MFKNKDIQTTKAYTDALNEAKQLISQSQEKFLRSANRKKILDYMGIHKNIML